MSGKVQIKGFSNVMANLNKEIKAIEGRTVKGMIESAIVIRRDMDKTDPKIPIDLGNLRASWFTVANRKEGIGSQGDTARTFKGKKASEMKSDRIEAISESKGILTAVKFPSLIMGFSANYAIYVHENVDANFAGDASKIKHTKKGKVTAKTKKYTRRAGAGAKFFESSVKRNSGKVIKIIQQNTKIKG